MSDRIPYHRPTGQTASRRIYATSPERKADQAFYDSATWKRLRRMKLAASPLCEPCKREGIITPAQHVHHVAERKDRPDLALTVSNLESVCRPCHNRKRGRGEGRG